MTLHPIVLAASLSLAAVSLRAFEFDLGTPWLLEPDGVVEVAMPPAMRTAARPPLAFERNEGQADAAVGFLVRGLGCRMALGRDEWMLWVGGEPRRPRREDEPWRPADADPEGALAGAPRMLRMRVVGAEPEADVVGEEPLAWKTHYFLGNDPAGWRTQIQNFAKVRCRGVYPGIDLVYYGNEGQLEYDLVVAPGADPGRIQFVIEGADRVEVDAEGHLRLGVADQEVVWRRPTLYQGSAGDRLLVAGGYQVGPAERADDGTIVRRVSFHIPAYDRLLALVIDPVLAYSTFLGGSGDDSPWSAGLAMDAEGNAYVTGNTASANFPLKSALFTNWSGGSFDAFLSKFSPSGDLLFSTYFGGTGSDIGVAVAVDPAGIVYVAGETDSSTLPLVHPVQSKHGGRRDTFLAGFTTDGASLVVSTYLGGSGNDPGYAMTLGADRSLYVTGGTSSTNFPLRNAVQSTLSPPNSDGAQFLDAFVARFAPGGTNLIYSTYYGYEDGNDRAKGVAQDGDGNAYVAVSRCSTFGCDLVDVLKFTAAGEQQLLVATFGGGDILLDPSIAVSSGGRVTLAAWTNIPGLSTLTPPGPNFPEFADSIVAQFDANDGSLIHSAYLGGGSHDFAASVAVDQEGDIVILGTTCSPDFPTVNPIQSNLSGCPDLFLTKLRAIDLSIAFSTYFGGSLGESLSTPGALALGRGGEAHFTASTQSSVDFPLMRPFQPTSGGKAETFVAKIVFGETLRIRRSGTAVTVSWPASAVGFVLETTPVLGPGATWMQESTAPSVVGEERVVTLPVGATPKYFRLRK